jgi:HlyD family secretion protein
MPDRVKTLQIDKSRYGPGRRSRAKWLLFVALLLCLGVWFFAQGYHQALGTYLARLPLARLISSQSPFSSATLDTFPVAASVPGGSVVLSTSGYIAAENEIHISPKIPGTIVELPIEEGSRVAAGDLIARIESDQYEAELKGAQANLARAKARLAELRAGARVEELEQSKAALSAAEADRDLAEQEAKRAENLRGTISPAEYEQKVSALRKAEAVVREAKFALQLLESGVRGEQIAAAEADVQSAEALVDKARFFCDHARILAPQSGTILEKSVELGEVWRMEMLVPSLCVMADLSQLRAEVDISERDLAQVRLEQPCRITPEAFPDRTYRGRVAWISPMANRQRGVVAVKFEVLDPDAHLLPHMNCNVALLNEADSESAAGTFHIPQRAVQEEGERTIVFVVDEGQKARKRVVVLGRTIDDEMVEVTTGLQAGELVLLPDGRALHEGQPIHR